MCWVKLHRKFLDWEWFDEEGMVKLFLTLLLMANYEDKKWHGITVHRGQVLTSRDKLAKKVRLSVRSLRTCLSRLEQTGEIDLQTTNKYTIITISNYDRYQVKEDDERPIIDQQPTSNRPATDQQPTTTKEIKEYNISLSNARAYEDWRYVSSAAKAAFNYDADMIADYKRRMMAKQLDGIAVEIGMPEEAKEKFLQRWAEHNPGSETIAAEYENTFDLRDRAVRFMTWWNRNNNRTSTTAQQPTRSDRFAEGMKRLDALFDGYGQAAHPVDEQ